MRGAQNATFGYLVLSGLSSLVAPAAALAGALVALLFANRAAP